MSNSVLLGVIATVVALVVFLVWTYHELKRVDELAPPDGDTDGDDDAGPA